MLNLRPRRLVCSKRFFCSPGGLYVNPGSPHKTRIHPDTLNLFLPQQQLIPTYLGLACFIRNYGSLFSFYGLSPCSFPNDPPFFLSNSSNLSGLILCLPLIFGLAIVCTCLFLGILPKILCLLPSTRLSPDLVIPQSSLLDQTFTFIKPSHCLWSPNSELPFFPRTSHGCLI